MTEIDWSIGEILSALEETDNDKNTLLVFTSDNGPWLEYGNHAGSNAGFREGKHTVFDGGTRVFCVMRWPGHIPSGKTCDQPAMTIDLLPTFANLTGTSLPSHAIDGLNIWPLISCQTGAQSPHEAYFFFHGKELKAVLRGKWKLHYPHSYLHVAKAGVDGSPGENVTLELEESLFDLGKDPGEQVNLISQFPDIAGNLKKLGEAKKKEIETGNRAAGRL
jgi:arylsulfatase A-like enzyme